MGKLGNGMYYYDSNGNKLGLQWPFGAPFKSSNQGVSTGFDPPKPIKQSTASSNSSSTKYDMKSDYKGSGGKIKPPMGVQGKAKSKKKNYFI